MPLVIHRESVVETPDEGGDGFRIDFKFQIGSKECVYYGMEAKKLNVVHASTGKVDSQARLYIKQGMVRYAKGKYALGLPEAGMLGFVMSDTIESARASIVALLGEFAEVLCVSDLRLVPSEESDLFSTSHAFSSGNMKVNHLFLRVL